VDFGVVVNVSRAARGWEGTLYFCTIECCRRAGFEPTRLRLPAEYDEPCAQCGFDPVQEKYIEQTSDHEED